MTNSRVLSSFRLTNCAGLWDWPGCSPVKPYLDRQNLSSQTTVLGLAEIFDQIDAIFSVSSQCDLSQPIILNCLFLENLPDSSHLVPAADNRTWGDDTPGYH